MVDDDVTDEEYQLAQELLFKYNKQTANGKKEKEKEKEN
jgi:hypothetical protein